jgi:hypothetical protein
MPKLLLAGVLLASVAPATADAAKLTLGSSLVADATLVESHPRDWMAYPTAQAGGGEFVAPAHGEVSWVDLKGSIIEPSPGYPQPNVVMHVVVTRPTGGGDKLMVSTEDLPLPYGGDPNRVSSFNLQALDARICVEAGDHVALATSGGFGNHFPEYGAYPDDFYADGAPFQLFGAVPGSSIGLFEQPAGTDTYQVGDVEQTQAKAGRELLMRVTVGTGPDARWTCRTEDERKQGFPNPGETPDPAEPSAALNPVDVPAPEHDPHVSSKGTVPIRIYCRAVEGCTGTLTLTRGTAVVATAPLNIPAKTTAKPRLKLSKAARRKLKRRGAKLSVTATATVNGYTVTRALRLVRKGA